MCAGAGMKWFVVAFGLGSWLWARLAVAQAEGSFHLDYEAPLGCPTAAAFAHKVEGHTPLARLASEGEVARRFRAVFDTTGTAARGRLQITDFEGSSSLREVEGRDCNEVADALALIAAIVIDPNARPTSPEPTDPSAATRPRPVTEVTMPPPKPLPEPKPARPQVPAENQDPAQAAEPPRLRLGLTRATRFKATRSTRRSAKHASSGQRHGSPLVRCAGRRGVSACGPARSRTSGASSRRAPKPWIHRSALCSGPR
jgi:hypothetical protein